MLSLTPNTQAVLLLTAPLIVGRGSAAAELLSPGEYKRFAQRLHEMGREPADLLRPNAASILDECGPVIDVDRVTRLLGRGLQLSQAVERWQTRAIWVVSRADQEYPRRLKERLRKDAPVILYGCGQLDSLNDGGLAVVGSRHVEEALFQFALDVGHLSGRAGRTVISGGAKGIDQAAMRGALESGGRVCGVLADSLEKQVMTRDHRNMLVEGQLTLVSPFDPNAGFNTGNAMQRNKTVYALADAALVVSSDVNKGGTWAGAIEQLNKFRFLNVYVRATGTQMPGLQALRNNGALAWPDPESAEDLHAVIEAPTACSSQPALSIFPADDPAPNHQSEPPRNETVQGSTSGNRNGPGDDVSAASTAPGADKSETPAEKLFAAARLIIVEDLARKPIKDVDVAAALEIPNAQAKAWLNRLVEERVLEKRKKPAGYVACARKLL